MGTQVQKSLDEVGWDKVRSSVPLVKSGRSCRLRKMPSLCSVWRKTAGLLPWLVLGCQSTPVSNGTGVVNPTSYEEVQEAASSERLNDSLRLQRWGSERAESVGDIVVLTGEIKGEPFRLWFMGAGLIFPRREWVFSSYKTARMMDRFVVVPVVSESFRGVNFAGTF